jgi:transmembrane 9 superfamily protein 2/4
MPVSWCYQAEHDTYCDTGFPMGCYIDKERKPKEACGLIEQGYRVADTYYIFNHVDITITYHSGAQTDWGSQLGDNAASAGRIIGT